MPLSDGVLNLKGQQLQSAAAHVWADVSRVAVSCPGSELLPHGVLRHVQKCDSARFTSKAIYLIGNSYCLKGSVDLV